MSIQWYPGHMTKAKREMLTKVKMIDGVIEVLDARIPISSRNPDFDEIFKNKRRLVVLNKSDLADKKVTSQWINYYKQNDIYAIDICATRKNDKKRLIQFIEKSFQDKTQRNAQRGIKKDIKLMIVGIPNCGKSTVINLISKQASAKTGNRPGVTKGQQLIRVTNSIVLLDTPGVLWPKFEDDNVALNLALTGAIREQVLDVWDLASHLCTKTSDSVKQKIIERYSLDSLSEDEVEAVGSIAKARGFLLKGGEYDLDRAAQTVLTEFKNGKWGAISLESPQE